MTSQLPGGNEESPGGGGGGPEGGGTTVHQTIDYVWSMAYIDAMVLRDRDTDASGSNTTALLDPGEGVGSYFPRSKKELTPNFSRQFFRSGISAKI